MDRQETQAWLDSLQVGDKVAIDTGGYPYQNWKVITIVKITPTRMFKTDDQRSFNKNGRERIPSTIWNSGTTLNPYTSEIAEVIERKQLTSVIDNTKFNQLSLEQLREIDRIIKGS